MSITSFALRLTAAAIVVTGTYYTGKYFGRVDEARDHKMSINNNNDEAKKKLDALRSELEGSVPPEHKSNVELMFDALYKRIENNKTIRVIWEDLVADIESIKTMLSPKEPSAT